APASVWEASTAGMAARRSCSSGCAFWRWNRRSTRRTPRLPPRTPGPALPTMCGRPSRPGQGHWPRWPARSRQRLTCGRSAGVGGSCWTLWWPERTGREGGLRPDVTSLDIVWLIEQFGRRAAARPGAQDENVRLRLLAIALAGLRARDAEPLPGTPPTVQHYEGRWRYSGAARLGSD